MHNKPSFLPCFSVFPSNFLIKRIENKCDAKVDDELTKVFRKKKEINSKQDKGSVKKSEELQGVIFYRFIGYHNCCFQDKCLLSRKHYSALLYFYSHLSIMLFINHLKRLCILFLFKKRRLNILHVRDQAYFVEHFGNKIW